MGSRPDRMDRHDTEAIPLARDAWESFGYELFPYGTETDNPRLREVLYSNQRDFTSRLLRWRPDFVLAKENCRSMFCEVKSGGQGYRNFSIEANSYISAQRHSQAEFASVYVFVDLQTAGVRCCWTTDIPIPAVIKVPRRDGWRETVNQLRACFPAVQMVDEQFDDYGRKSGTPYFLIPKSSTFLLPVPTFIQAHDLLRPPPLLAVPTAQAQASSGPDQWGDEWRLKRIARMWKSIRSELPGNIKVCLLDSEPIALQGRVLTIGLLDHLLPNYKSPFGLEIKRAIKQVADVTCDVRVAAKRRVA